VPQTQRYCTHLGGAVRNNLKLNEHCDLPDQLYSDYCVVLVSLSAHRELSVFATPVASFYIRNQDPLLTVIRFFQGAHC